MNVEPMIAATAGWLLTVALHGGLFLLAAWLIDRTWHAPPNAWRELMWRVALFGGVITASMQPIAGPSPIAARWQLDGTRRPPRSRATATAGGLPSAIDLARSAGSHASFRCSSRRRPPPQLQRRLSGAALRSLYCARRSGRNGSSASGCSARCSLLRACCAAC
jgi:hypothetical protein